MSITRLISYPMAITLAVLCFGTALTAASFEILNESVSCGWQAREDNSDLPRLFTMYQVVNSTAFADQESILAAARYDVLARRRSGEPIDPKNLTGTAVAHLYVIQEDGTRTLLGRIKAQKAQGRRGVGYSVVDLPVPVEQGDLLQWVIRLRRFSDVPAYQEIQVLAGIGLPEMLTE